MTHCLKFFLIVLLFVRVTQDCNAQQLRSKLTGQGRVDSLLKELPSAREDTNKVILLNDITYAYTNIEPAVGIKYGQSAVDLAQKMEWKKGVAVAYGNLGVNYMALSDYPKALEFGLKSLKINEDLGDKKATAGNLGNIGNVYTNQGDYPAALEYYSKALKIFEDQNNKNGIAITLGNIGNTYADLNNYPKSLEYSLRALAICEELGNEHGTASNLGNISSVYVSEGNYAKGLEYAARAVKIFEEIGDKNNLIVNLGNIGECYLKMAQDTAIKQSARDKKANLTKAIDYSSRAIAICKETGNLDYFQTFSENLSTEQELIGDYKNALENYKQYRAINDSVFGNENKIKILNLETKRDLDLKNKQIEIDRLAVAKKQNERRFYIIGIVLLLLVIVFIWRNYNSQKKSNAQLSVEKQRSEDLLLNILPAEVADELKNKGTAAAKHYDNVTVMFTDFVNFTQAGERMSPEALIAELHACFKAFDEIISGFNIEKIKTIGDAYLAVSGLPKADACHAENIVKAAIEINKFMKNRQEHLGNKTFEVRIGIHSGSVVAGIVGVKKFAYDIWGDTVNTAARIEENSAAGKINMSQVTFELVKEKFACTYRGNIVAKNKGELSMYFLEKAL